MRIRQVCLTNFRVYQDLQLELAPGLNFFQGRNGQGKTALLEAIYCLATSRSFRTAHESEILRWGESMAWVQGDLVTMEGRPRQLALSWQSRRGRLSKELSRQGQKVERLADFLGELPLALFVPEDLRLVQGGPAERRRYLDLILCKLYPGAVDCLGRYQKVLSSRNALLKRSPAPGGDELAPWNALMAPLAAELVERRRALLAHLADFVIEVHTELVGCPQKLALPYRPQFEGDAQAFFAELERRERDDLRRGTTQVGPHRDDFEMLVDGVDVRHFGSQGQCRSLALALRLAQGRFFQEVNGESAVVLLDDCFSELDSGRQERLLRLLSRYSQVAVTSATPVEVQVEASFYEVEGGRVARR